MSYSTATEIVLTAPGRLEARTSLAGRVVSAVLILFGLAAILFAAIGHRLVPSPIRLVSGCFLFPLYPFGAIFLLVGLLMWGRQRMAFDSRDRAVRLRRAVKGIGHHVPFGHVEAVEIVPDDSAGIAGKIDLVLSRPAGRRLGVAMREGETKLQEDASRLAEFIGVPVRDARQAAVPVPGAAPGREIMVSRGFSGAVGTANFRTHELFEAGRGLLMVKPTGGSRAFRGVFLGSGVALLACAVILVGAAVAGKFTSFWGAVFAVGICLVVGGAFVACSLTLLSCPPVFLDRRDGEVRGRKLRVAGRLLPAIPLRLVAAVQIVSGRVTGFSESPDYTAYEVNLVLSDPPGQRLALMAHSKEQHIRADARRLAEFLGVPLLDHTAPAGADDAPVTGTG